MEPVKNNVPSTKRVSIKRKLCSAKGNIGKSGPHLL